MKCKNCSYVLEAKDICAGCCPKCGKEVLPALKLKTWGPNLNNVNTAAIGSSGNGRHFMSEGKI